MKNLSYLICIVGLCVLFAACSEKDKPLEPKKKSDSTSQKEPQKPDGYNKMQTKENVVAVQNSEANHSAKFAEYAKAADKEGFSQVASMFRALEKSEKIHASIFGGLAKKFAANPNPKIILPEIKSTMENLNEAITEETRDKEAKFPEVLKMAQNENQEDGMRFLPGAIKTETEHIALLNNALKDLEKMKSGKLEFRVCPLCGYTALNPKFRKCPVCDSEISMFLKIK